MTVKVTDGETVRTASADRKSPIVLDLGTKKRKAVKRLRKGEGKLLDDVMDTIEELRTSGTLSQSAQPVIVVVREKRKAGLLPFMGR
jgi:hypothetical protein